MICWYPAVADVRGAGPLTAVRALRGLIEKEHAKSQELRRMAYRNQVLMLIKNAHVDDLARSFADITLTLAGQTSIAVILDPVGTLAGRADLVRRLPDALRARSAAPVRRSLAGWLP